MEREKAAIKEKGKGKEKRRRGTEWMGSDQDEGDRRL